MAFRKEDVEQLLASCGRMCCVCKKLHQVQVHHIIPSSEGGNDDMDNAIALCPNCHDEVHQRSHYSPGCTARLYSVEELKRHRELTIQIAQKEKSWQSGKQSWEEDRNLMLFFAQCLDRPAFRTYFHEELSFSDFDRAMEDTITAINTGCTRIGEVTLPVSRGKIFLVHRPWRDTMDNIVELLEKIRSALRDELGLNEMLMHLESPHRRHARFQRPSELGEFIDQTRQQIVARMNEVLRELDRDQLPDFKLKKRSSR